jgi:hypothetical protein
MYYYPVFDSNATATVKLKPFYNSAQTFAGPPAEFSTAPLTICSN